MVTLYATILLVLHVTSGIKRARGFKLLNVGLVILHDHFVFMHGVKC
jgi:hypothetical protein